MGTATATEMGHLPIGGSQGSLISIAPLPHVDRTYVHINNTNPILREDSPERAAVLAAGVRIGSDGTQFSL
jgi:pyrroloquinoline quinone biosynthesis protein B